MDLPTAPYWQFALGSEGEVVTGLDELAQALKILLHTPLGSDPLRPEFGCDLLQHLDRPGPQATAAVIREISRAVARWEPRISLQKIRVTEITAEGTVALAITWTPSEVEGGSSASSSSSASTTTEVTVSGDYVPTSAVGAPGGVAPLSAAGIVPAQYLPESSGSDISVIVDGGEL